MSAGRKPPRVTPPPTVPAAPASPAATGEGFSPNVHAFLDALAECLALDILRHIRASSAPNTGREAVQ